MNDTLALSLTRRAGLRLTTVTNVALVLLGTLIIALLAQVRILLPFTPVPVTGQTLGVLLVAASLGSRRGTASLGLYLAGGLAGLPFFTGGASGLAYFSGVTGGYLIGFLAAALLVGRLAEHGWTRSWYKMAALFALGTLVIYLFGAAYLATFTGLRQALVAGVWPFLPGDVIKAALAAALLPAAWKLSLR
jgi:biotin transport system substrate-specific component